MLRDSRIFAVNLLSFQEFCCQTICLIKPFSKYIPCSSQSFKRFLFFLFSRFGINIHRGFDVLMSHNRLNDLQVGLLFAKPCAKGVPKMVRREIRQKNCFPVFPLRADFLCGIIIGNNPFNNPVDRLGIGNIPKAVAKDETVHSVNRHIVPAVL